VNRRGKLTPNVEWASCGGQGRASRLTPRPGFRKFKLMVKHRTHSAEFKRQVEEYDCAGATEVAGAMLAVFFVMLCWPAGRSGTSAGSPASCGGCATRSRSRP